MSSDTLPALNLRALAEHVSAAQNDRGNQPEAAETLTEAWRALLGGIAEPEALALAERLIDHDTPAMLLTGLDAYDDGTEYLVTVWRSGQMQVATRNDNYATWGIPTDLTPAP